MAAASRRIIDLQSLDREIVRLKSRCKELEGQIDLSLGYLQENYTSMTLKTVLPYLIQKAGFAGSLAQIFLQNDRLRENLSKLTNYVFDRISDGLEYLADKIHPNKED
jgi:hypothetical protein